ncbi:hypothetical protein DICVIV_10542 [Dictyocaulus viviparus]|uniref:Uncharacterized protein n=1 Tax=Dictyocaulus viviparus TaxID=29172 RepID=A0A0D8XI81_DICVI|nr:hypothetical protein DICVIV_10542 [Dictyocaulus viviparus]
MSTTVPVSTLLTVLMRMLSFREFINRMSQMNDYVYFTSQTHVYEYLEADDIVQMSAHNMVTIFLRKGVLFVIAKGPTLFTIMLHINALALTERRRAAVPYCREEQNNR